MGLNGLEPSTSRLSGVRSNQLSYRPLFAFRTFVLRDKPLKTKQRSKPCRVPYYLEHLSTFWFILRKEVIQPHLPIRLPCYDFTPIIDFTLDGWLPKVTPPALGTSDFRGVTGGVYKARERIHRSMLTCDY